MSARVKVMQALNSHPEFRAMQGGKQAGRERKTALDNPFTPCEPEYRAWETGRYTEELRRMKS